MELEDFEKFILILHLFYISECKSNIGMGSSEIHFFKYSKNKFDFEFINNTHVICRRSNCAKGCLTSEIIREPVL